MSKKVTKIKKRVFEILIVSSVLLAITSSITVLSISFIPKKHLSNWLIGIGSVCLVLDIILLISVICGVTFLTKNRNIDDAERFKVRSILDFGLLYFVQSAKIDRVIEHYKSHRDIED
ncbi:hypothetical protein SHELI_v1c05370 [Spiroplasma helicoides]|uniref:Uncharacterized protein n=1 Tax=Spiroplasma helicoides TaxID=216938 RepID=A0A1B3SKL5_9MOLU|nr:hypothetical protein [Spiroplasma helicoides]AOG60488.1 hypothetical protein SHELI_v1c05370 [Spiroplasma helicoides]